MKSVVVILSSSERYRVIAIQVIQVLQPRNRFFLNIEKHKITNVFCCKQIIRINSCNSSQDLREAPEHPLDLWSLLQSVATKRTERKKASKARARVIRGFLKINRNRVVVPCPAVIDNGNVYGLQRYCKRNKLPNNCTIF